MVNIGKRIATARERAGLNQSELARALKVTPQSVQAWESDKNTPRPKKLEAIAAVLGTSISHLMGEADAPDIVLTQRREDETTTVHLEIKHGAGDKESVPNVTELIRYALARGSLKTHDVQLLNTMVRALIERNKGSETEVPHLPTELDALAESAFSNADSGGDSEDMVQMIGHGLKKSGAKESSKRDAKRKTGSD